MQNTMLDSTISTLNQDNSSVEYVDSHENSIATVQTDVKNLTSANSLFDFHATHNGEACIESLDPKDRGTERQLRFTRALLCTLLGVKSENTITNHVDALINRGVVSDVKNLTSVMLPDSLGRECVKTTLYDLKVFNYLVMRLDTDQAWEKKAKFNDVLVERETGVTQTQPQPTLPTTYLEALEALVASEKAKLALQAERDEAIRTKAMIGSKREATAMATASAKSRECEKLREQIGDSETYKRATAIPWLSEYFDTRNDGLYNSIAAQLKKIEASMPPEFAHKPTPDTRYGSVKAYHIAVIEKFHELVREKLPVDEKFMSKYRKDVSPKTKNA